MCKLKYFHISDIYVSYIHLYTIYSIYISNIHDNTNYYTHIRIYIFYLLPASNKVCVFAQTYIQQQTKPNTDVAHFTSHTIQHSRKRVSDLYIQIYTRCTYHTRIIPTNYPYTASDSSSTKYTRVRCKLKFHFVFSHLHI